MNKITLNIAGNEYEFTYSKDFRILKKREDGGTEFYPFTRFAYWTPCGRRGPLKKSDVVLTIKHKLGII